MVVRYAVWMTIRPDERWTGDLIPVAFHLVLASFLLVVAQHHRRLMTISEPATLVTDYLLAIFTAVLAFRLLRTANNAGRDDQTAGERRWWSAAFALTAIAGATGGTVHGFQHVLAPAVADGLWLVSLESLVAAAFAVVGGAIAFTRPGPSIRSRATFAAGLAFAAYGLWLASNPVFLGAIVAYGVALAILVAARLRERPLHLSGRLVLGGVAVSVAAAVIQQSGWSIHRYFNHNDLYHVVQAVGVWLLYRGAMRGDR